MELKNFKLPIPGRGTIDVECALHFNDSIVSVSEIKIHSDFDSRLPHRPQLMMHDNTWQLHAQQPVMKNGEVVVVDHYFNDDISRKIVEKLLALRDDAKVR